MEKDGENVAESNKNAIFAVANNLKSRYKMKKFLILACTAALFAACSNETTEELSNPSLDTRAIPSPIYREIMYMGEGVFVCMENLTGNFMDAQNCSWFISGCEGPHYHCPLCTFTGQNPDDGSYSAHFASVHNGGTSGHHGGTLSGGN